ncbi:MAG: AraC family transcriptional regulator [Sphingobacteriales bacterium]|nr:AraC family transcriptional regulator [Sphingobacteriales bacterium]
MTQRPETRNDYHVRINKVLEFINAHLEESPELEKLASIANFSAFHFHRIMRAYLGEPLSSFIQRLRLDKAANLLINTKLPIQDISWMVGYDNPASLTRAFKKRFGVSPANFRNEIVFQTQALQFVQINKSEKIMKIKPKFKKRKEKRVIYVMSIGPYDSAGTAKAWDKVSAFASEKRLWGFGTEFIGISYDDPHITEEEKLRYEACITVSKDVRPEGEIGVKTIEGGNYAVFRHLGPYEKLNETYDYIYRQWLPESGKTLRDIHCFEKYLNSPGKTPPEKLKTDIYIPLV